MFPCSQYSATVAALVARIGASQLLMPLEVEGVPSLYKPAPKRYKLRTRMVYGNSTLGMVPICSPEKR
jgi:hypothetical protein